MASIVFDDDAGERCVLVCKPEQSGKTFVMIREIDKDVKFDLGETNTVINFIFCDNSLLLNKQTSMRVTSESVALEWNKGSVDYEPFAEFSSRKDKDAEGDYIACQTHGEVYGKIVDGVRNIVCCTNGTRVNDIDKLVRRINKSPLFAGFIIKIWLDEADKFVGFIDKTFSPLIKTHTNVSCYYLTATPETLFKKETRQFSVMPLETTFAETYHGWDDNSIELHDEDHGGGGTITFATQIVDDVRKTGVNLNGTKWYIPADRAKKTHAKMSDDLVLRGFAVFVVNGNGISLTIPGISTPIQRGKTDELHIVIRRLINEHSLEDYPIAVTGNVCVGRGISIMAPGKYDEDTDKYLKEFIFDYGVLSNSTNKTEASQNAGRIKGNIKEWTGYKPPIVHTTHKFDKIARVCEKRSRELAKLAFDKDETLATRITKAEFNGITDVKPPPIDDYTDYEEPLVEEFTNLDEINKFFKDNGCAKACRKISTFKRNDDGFIMSSTTKKLSVLLYSQTKCEMESWNKGSWIGTKKSTRRSMAYGRMTVTYKDIGNINTVVYIARILKKKKTESFEL
jgi:hypothetical protein